MRAPLLILPIILTLLVSGCTTPDFLCIIPGLCGQTVEKTHDVIVIESLKALPNNIPPEGTIKLVAIISNMADVDAEITNLKNIHVELYDFCEGLFKITSNSKGKSEADIGISLVRGEKKQVEWTLTALGRDQVPVETSCTLKVRARYPYATKSITTLHLIDYAEMQRRINEGTYREVTSYTSTGYGPIVPYLTVEGTQPIPVDEGNKMSTVISLQIKNRGNGFLSDCSGLIPCKECKSNGKDVGPVIRRDQVEINSVGQDKISTDIANKLNDKDTGIGKFFSDKCDSTTYVKLIKKESTPMPVTLSGVDASNVPVESTKTLQASIGEIDKDGNLAMDKAYWYEFRKEIKVTVEPRF